jgi:hypothetical protein
MHWRTCRVVQHCVALGVWLLNVGALGDQVGHHLRAVEPDGHTQASHPLVVLQQPRRILVIMLSDRHTRWLHKAVTSGMPTDVNTGQDLLSHDR